MKRENIIIGLILFLFLFSVFLTVGRNITRKKDSHNIEPLISSRQGVALLYLYGMINTSSASYMSHSSNIDSFINSLYKIEKNPRVKALVVRINSPGGTAGSAQELYNELIKFKKRTSLPVIVSIADIGASGAYWVSLASDKIFANPGSMIGSIGVIINNLSLYELAEKYGVYMNTIKSGKYKDILSSWRKTTPDEKRILKNLIDDIHNQFVKNMIFSRNISKKKAYALADGRIFSGQQAKKLGLIDELGGLQDAINYAAKKAGIKGRPHIITRPQNPVFQLLNTWKSQFKAALGEMLVSQQGVVY
ncbi:MAG: signal peptide peptidase SppA [bacterium]|nr:signal peptide peptidase SppA [bacterium]